MSIVMTPVDRTQLAPEEQVAALTGISLGDLNEAAALQARVDRKYILDPAQLAALLDGLTDRLAALEIDGQRSFGYESVYFDTPDLESFRSAAHKRRKRFKVRTRSYLDTRTTMLEVKTKGQRGGIVKTRQEHEFGRRAELDRHAADFIDPLLGRHGFAATLRPTLATRYDRMTVVDLDDVTRMTIDSGLRCLATSGASIGLDRYIVETKSADSPSVADRWLWRSGIRPSTISKFGTGMAALDPSLPSNRWNRTLNRYFR